MSETGEIMKRFVPHLIVVAVVTATLAGAASVISEPAPESGIQSSSGTRGLPQTEPPTEVVAGDDSPISFSDPDGQELILDELHVRAVVEGMLSLTELEMRFTNPHERVMEGRFTATMPAGATISRFAKEVNGQLMEGEVVERLRANRVYDEILHEMRDPALLEQEQGNRFSARIFPIPAGGTVRLILSYSRLLPAENGIRRYILPLRGMPKIGRFRFDGSFTPLAGETISSSPGGSSSKPSSPQVTHEAPIDAPAGMTRSNVEVVRMDENDFTPDRDLEIAASAGQQGPTSRILRAGDFYLVSFQVSAGAEEDPAVPHDWIFYVDTSASSADSGRRRIAAIESLLRALPASDPVQLIAFDQTLALLATGKASRVAARAAALLESRHFLGGTNLGLVLEDAASRTKSRPRSAVIFTDGVATMGRTARNDIAAAASRIGQGSLLHAVVLGSRSDEQALRSITSGRGRVITIPFSHRTASSIREALRKLTEPLGATVSVRDDGAEWLFPEKIEDARPGEEYFVLGRLRPAGEPAPIFAMPGTTIRISDASRGTAAYAPLLEREAYRAYLDHLSSRETNETSEAVRSALATEQTRISVEQRILIPSTTMLVLESESDYRRFGLDRRALASILTIEGNGISVIDGRGTDIRDLRQKEERQFALEREQQRRQQKATTPPRRDEGGVVGGVVGGESSPEPVAESQVADSTAATPSTGSDFAGDSPMESTAVQANSQPALAEEAPTGARANRDAPASPPPPPGAPRPSLSPAMPSPIPSPAPSLPVGPTVRQRAPQEDDRQRSTWTETREDVEQRVADLTAELEKSPRDRMLYNSLGEGLLRLKRWEKLRELTFNWQPLDPDNPQVYELLGEAARKLENPEEAARAFGSLVELAPAKPELLQRAGLLLLRAGEKELAQEPLRRALELRPDRVNAYRHLALLYWQQGRFEEGARLLESAVQREFPQWYGDAQRVLREELAYIYRAWIKADPKKESEIITRARNAGADLQRRDALRVTLAWETDANDVDLHVVDPDEEECFYGDKQTRSGLELYGDITQGFGPEVIRTARRQKGPYHVGVKYFRAGPMGVSRGIVVVIQPDGSGDDEPEVQIVPFRLLPDGGDIRRIMKIE